MTFNPVAYALGSTIAVLLFLAGRAYGVLLERRRAFRIALEQELAEAQTDAARRRQEERTRNGWRKPADESPADAIRNARGFRPLTMRDRT